MVAPIEQPIATFFFSGVPSMGCQLGDLREVRIPRRWVLCGHGDLR